MTENGNGKPNKHSPASEQLVKVERQRKVWEDWCKGGIRSKKELAVRHGVTTDTIADDLRAKWAEFEEAMQERSAHLVMDLTALLFSDYAAAGQEFERSKQSKETVTTAYIKESCGDCEGTGFDSEVPKRWCRACGGDGEVQVERVTRKLEGQAGDPAYLRVRMDLLKEIKTLNITGPEGDKAIRGGDQYNLFLGSAGSEAARLTDEELLDLLEAFYEKTGKVKVIDTD